MLVTTEDCLPTGHFTVHISLFYINHSMEYYRFYQLALLPVVSALIGWITNYIAVKMLFRPRRPWGIFKIQGLLPKRQKELARKIGQTVEDKLLSIDDVLSNLDEKELQTRITPLIESTIDSFLQKKLQQIPMIGMVLQGTLLSDIKDSLVQETMLSLPKIISAFGDSLQQNVSLRQIVQDRVERFDLSVLEEIVYDISGTELRAIELMGGVLGFIIGLVQVGIVLM